MRGQFFALLVSRGLSSGIQAVSIILLARWVGIESFGVISVITGVGAVVFTVADWGLSSYIPRARAKGINQEVVTGLRMNAMGNAGAGVVFAATLLFIYGTDKTVIWLSLIPIALALDQFTETGLTVAIADKRRGLVATSILMRRGAGLVVFVVLFYFNINPLCAYTVGLLVGGLLGFAHVLVDLRRRLRSIGGRAGARRMYRALTPYLTANLSAASRTLDSAIVAATTSATGAGLYSAAFRVTRPLMLIGSSAVAVILPHAARESLSTVKRLGRRLSLAALAACIPLLVVAAFSTQIVTLLFGPSFAAAGPAFAFAVLAIPFLSLAPPLGGMLQGQGQQSFVAVNGVVFAVFTLSLVFVFALIWGPTGAAAAIALSYLVKCSALYVRLQRTRPAS